MGFELPCVDQSASTETRSVEALFARCNETERCHAISLRKLDFRQTCLFCLEFRCLNSRVLFPDRNLFWFLACISWFVFPRFYLDKQIWNLNSFQLEFRDEWFHIFLFYPNMFSGSKGLETKKVPPTQSRMQLSARVPFANGQLTDVANGAGFQSVPNENAKGKRESRTEIIGLHCIFHVKPFGVLWCPIYFLESWLVLGFCCVYLLEIYTA